jgi:hypothetical protein
MTFKPSFLKTTFLLTCALCLSGLFVPALVPRAHALFWEDDNGSNDPNEVKTRPDHFDLFDWVGDLNQDAKVKEYRQMDNHDRGPSVNNDSRSLEIVSSGIVGLGLGLVAADRFTPMGDSSYTSNMFIGGALGLCAGIIAGSMIMPHDYEVDQVTQTEFLRSNQAWLQDPVRLQVAQAFRPTQTAFTLQF